MMHRFTIGLIVTILSGCAAMGVPATNDPGKKLGWAINLYENQNRPLPAERLIQEARDIYISKNDDLGLAEAYRQYAFFLCSQAVKKYERLYRKEGFLDKGIDFDARYEKAVDYLKKANDIYAKNGKYDRASNVDLALGSVYLAFIGDENKGCAYYDLSLADHLKFKKQNPDTKVSFPDGFSSYEEYVADTKKRFKCK